MKRIGLGPYILVLPEANEKVAEMPPAVETWDLIIETIKLVQKSQAKKEIIWTDGTWIP